MSRTRAGRRATALPWTATLIVPIALIVVASFGARTHGFVGGMLLGICIALAIASGVVVALVGAGSAYVRTLPADDADVAHLADAARVADLVVLDGLEPLRKDRLGDDR